MLRPGVLGRCGRAPLRRYRLEASLCSYPPYSLDPAQAVATTESMFDRITPTSRLVCSGANNCVGRVQPVVRGAVWSDVRSAGAHEVDALADAWHGQGSDSHLSTPPGLSTVAFGQDVTSLARPQRQIRLWQTLPMQQLRNYSLQILQRIDALCKSGPLLTSRAGRTVEETSFLWCHPLYHSHQFLCGIPSDFVIDVTNGQFSGPFANLSS